MNSSGATAKIVNISLALVCILFSGATARGASWYVRSASACPGNGDGSAPSCAASAGSAGAWSGFSNIPWSSIHPGDSVFLASGDTYAGPLTLGASGNSTSPITITVSGGGTATINANSGTGINFSGNSYVTIDGVIGSPAFGGSISMGIAVNNIGGAGYCVYENSGGGHDKVFHVECYGTSPGSSQPDDSRGGLYLHGTYFEVGYNYIHGPAEPQYSSSKWGATCVMLYASTGTTNFNDNLVHDNRCDELFNDGIRPNSNTSVYKNEVSNVDGSGHSDSLDVRSGSYVAVYSNYVHDSGDQNIYLENLYDATCGHIRIYNNVLNSNPGHGINIDPSGGVGAAPAWTGCMGSSSGWNDVIIANNTIRSVSTYGVYWSERGTVTNLVLLNNIFGPDTSSGWYPVTFFGNGVSFAGGDSWDYDTYSPEGISYPMIVDFSSPYTALQLRALSVVRELHGKVCDPTYVNPSSSDFHLASSDTCARAAGENLASVYDFLVTDKDGNPRPTSGSWDLGAYQYGASANQPAPPTSVRATVQ